MRFWEKIHADHRRKRQRSDEEDDGEESESKEQKSPRLARTRGGLVMNAAVTLDLDCFTRPMPSAFIMCVLVLDSAHA